MAVHGGAEGDRGGEVRPVAEAPREAPGRVEGGGLGGGGGVCGVGRWDGGRREWRPCGPGSDGQPTPSNVSN